MEKSKKIKNWSSFLIINPALILVLSLLFSCQKAPINGDLDGMWQVMEVSPPPKEILIEGRLYYNFSLHVCALSSYGAGFTTGNMHYEGNLLTLDFPYAFSQENILKLKQYGINSNPVNFTVEYIDKNLLILKDGDTTVTLRKF